MGRNTVLPREEDLDTIMEITNTGMTITGVSSIDRADISESVYDSIFDRIVSELSKAPIMQHRCNNCGATVELDSDKHIFICPYCNSAYAIGTLHLNG